MRNVVNIEPARHAERGYAVVFAHALPPPRWGEIAAEISRHSKMERNILFRTPAVFLQLIHDGRLVLAMSHGAVIGSVSLHCLSASIAEIGSAWVDRGHRGQGVYSALKDAALQLGGALAATVISTSKVSVDGTSAGLQSSVSRGMLPMSFGDLERLDAAAYRACCSCDELRNYRHCDERDRSCILTASVDRTQALEHVLRFVTGPAWSTVAIGAHERQEVTAAVLRWSDSVATHPAPMR